MAGLVRASDKSDRLAAGVEPVVGSLTDLDIVRGAVEKADRVIHTAVGSGSDDVYRQDRAVIEAFGDVFRGSERAIVVTSGPGTLSARSVHGRGESHGVIPMIATAARKAGTSIYVDDGEQPFAAAHRTDPRSSTRPSRGLHDDEAGR